MEEEVKNEKTFEGRTYFDGSFMRAFKRKDGVDSDWKRHLVSSTDMDNIPPKLGQNQTSVNVFVTGVNLPEIEGQPVRYFGKWNEYRKPDGSTNISFNADAFVLLNPDTISGIVRLLSGPMFPGIGTSTATRIAKYCGLDTFRIIEEDPLRLAKIIDQGKIGIITRYYAKNQAYGRLVAFLGQFGLGSQTAVKVNDHFGKNAIRLITENPYCLEEISGIGFTTCDKIARVLGKALDSYQRIEGCLMETLLKLCSEGGHMYVEKNVLQSATLKRLNDGLPQGTVNAERYTEVFEQLRGLSKIVCRANSIVYAKSFDEAEYNTAQKLLFLLNKKIDSSKIAECEQVVDDYCEKAGIKLHPTQREAVIRSVSNRVSIITGGPGTGKTTIISAILACYDEVFGGDILLMAPTGKAARRMSESTKRDASTIHSRLHLYNAEGKKQKPEPINSGLVVVDECSMVDNFLMESLMEAIASDECHVIFVGDIDQLPSVGEGAVLGEMIKSGVIPTSRLTETFRQKGGGATIIDDAKKINTGASDLIYDETFEFVEAKDDKDACDKVMALYREEVAQRGIENVALLCPLRSTQDRFITVADSMNEKLQSVINPHDTAKREASVYRRTFREGDRVMQWKNTEDSSNGDIGEIKCISDDENGGGKLFTIEWENGNTSVLNRQGMEKIFLAYAISIHKSQGSEYQSVIIPVISAQTCELFKRNLLYTGVTRAKKKVILVGDTKAIRACISKSDTNRRNTLLAQRLVYNAKKMGLIK